ncbi:MAG: hypothetical protein ACJ73E_04015 [Mycobacteriales bacterium]
MMPADVDTSITGIRTEIRGPRAQVTAETVRRMGAQLMLTAATVLVTASR